MNIDDNCFISIACREESLGEDQVWAEFNEEKKYLFNDTVLDLILKFSGLPNADFSAQISNASNEERIRLKSIMKKITELQEELIRMPLFFSYLHELSDQLEKVKQTIAGSSVFAMPLKGRAKGPPRYPDIVRTWIVKVIDLAKGDPLKTDILISFFWPGGEFDKWIQIKSNGRWGGPQRSKMSEPLSIRSEAIKWLHSFKNQQKE
ncbi:MAG: hypothetical protein ACXVCN_16400 [Bdellovibrio sp.]